MHHLRPFLTAFAKAFRRFLADAIYRPETRYMRGPGPKSLKAVR
jgi:hypothetical protein